jgi:hypothetical protein
MRADPKLDELLDGLADAAMAAASRAGSVGQAAEVAAIAFASAAEMARAGLDPAEEFAKLHGASPMWRTLERVARKRFPQSDPAPSAPDTVPFSDPYEGMFDEEDSKP